MVHPKNNNFIPWAQPMPPLEAPGLVDPVCGNQPMLDFEIINNLAPVYTPYFDIKETTESYVFVTDLPGIKENDVDVEVCDGCLTIAGERAKDPLEDGDYYYALDRHFGTFCLTFQLPRGVEGERVKARMHDGVLTVNVPKVPRSPVSRVNIFRGDH